MCGQLYFEATHINFSLVSGALECSCISQLLVVESEVTITQFSFSCEENG